MEALNRSAKYIAILEALLQKPCASIKYHNLDRGKKIIIGHKTNTIPGAEFILHLAKEQRTRLELCQEYCKDCRPVNLHTLDFCGRWKREIERIDTSLHEILEKIDTPEE